MKGEGGRARGDKLKEMKGSKLFNQQSRVVLEEVHDRVVLEVYHKVDRIGSECQSE